MNDKEIIIQFLEEMAKQDNRGTAFPYFYVIKTKKSYVVGRDSNEPDETFACSEDWDGIEFLNEDFEEIDREEYVSRPEDERTKVYLRYYYEEKGMFLTEQDAENHLKANHYHYSKCAHTYVKHAWRTPYLTEFLTALFVHFNVDKGNLDIRMPKEGD